MELMQHATIARQFTPDEPQRVEAGTAEAVDIALNMAARAADPTQRPPEAQPPKIEPPKPMPMVYNFR
jgi:hypothetical protein